MILCYTVHYFFSIQNNYYAFQTVILHLINLYNYVCVCVLYYGDHHDSDRMAVLVWSSRLDIIVFVNTTNLCILCQIKISFLPSFLHIYHCGCSVDMVVLSSFFCRVWNRYIFIPYEVERKPNYTAQYTIEYGS